MTKWNKSDATFILKSLAISGFALLVWSFFYPYQINENYLNISLNEKEAKQKARQYFSSRGWDVSSYTYSSVYIDISSETDGNYTTEILANRDKEVIKNINQLSGAHRWLMRWYNPPNEEEFQIGYTKEGELTYFYHILPDTLAGDSLPQDIAINIAKMFLKDMTGSNWKEEDWDIKRTDAYQKPNRLDYYLQWENNKHNFDDSKIRMSIRVHGNEVVRYNRWLEESHQLKSKWSTWASISSFIDDISSFIFFITMLLAILISLFYFRISTNWQIATKYTITIFIIFLIGSILEIPTAIIGFSSKTPLSSSILFHLINEILNQMFMCFFLLVMFSAFEKLYRKHFPDHLSFQYIFNTKALTTKLFFNNYVAGLVCAVCAVSFMAVFHFIIQESGYYIAYSTLDFNNMLSLSPLISSIISSIVYIGRVVMPGVVLTLIIYQLSNSKILSISLASIFLSFQVFETDPIFISSIYLLFIGLVMGFLLFRYGILSVIIFIVTKSILSEVSLYFFTGDLYYIMTGIIIILLLLLPILGTVLYYVKYQSVTPSEELINGAEDISEQITKSPIIPIIKEINPQHKKWALLIVVIGLVCLLIPNNDELKDFWSYAINKSTAIQTAHETVENNYRADLSEFQVSTSVESKFSWNTANWSLGPAGVFLIERSTELAYLKEKLGRNGIKKLFEKYNISPNGWLVKFFIPDVKEHYYGGINPRENNLFYYFSSFHDTTTIPSVDQEEAKEIITNTLAKQNIDISSFPIDAIEEEKLDTRIDYDFNFKKHLSIDEKFSVDEIIHTGVAGNIVREFHSTFKVPEEWIRKYRAINILFILCFWLPLTIFIIAVFTSLYFLIENTYENRYEISWKFLGWIIFLITFISITQFINYIPIYKTWNYGDQSWLAYWLDDRIGNRLSVSNILLIFVIVPCSLAYFLNPMIKDIFSKKTINTIRTDAVIGSIATIGALLLYHPIKYLLYAYFPSYIHMDPAANYFYSFSTYLPIYNLLSQMFVETLWLFAVSIIFYHKFMEYSNNGKNIKKNLIITAVSAFYLFYNCFYELPVEMLPHFISRFSGLIIFFILIKYFWKGNPLSHLFGIFIYFQLDRIFSFIHLADPSIKSQGYLLLILLGAIFIYSVRLESFRKMFSSRTA